MAQETTREPAELQTTRMTDGPSPGPPRSLLVPGLVIAAHPDTDRIGEQSPLPALGSGKAVSLSRLEPLFSHPSGDSDPRPLNDPYLSRRALRLRPGQEPGSLWLELAGSRTRVEVAGEPVTGDRWLEPEAIEHGVVLTLGGQVVLLLQRVDPLPAELPHFGLEGASPAVHRLRREIRTAAGLPTSVLLRGETGTGKELVARALHQHGPRAAGPFVAVNMATLPPTLAASELFGAMRGAYTGADRQKPGLFQSAEGGTLFLDEIGESPPEVQAMLLRALETREIQPVGSVETRRVDVRILAATDADLDRAIEDGGFRAPLLHRLAGFEIRLPPLRERRDDIARLLMFFLEAEQQELHANAGMPFPPPHHLPAALIARLVAESWPGNVRQLRNVARRLALARHEGRDGAELLPLVEPFLDGPRSGEMRAQRPSELKPTSMAPLDRNAGAADAAEPTFRRPNEVGEEELLAALRSQDWNLRSTAATLGVSRATLYRLIEARPEVRKASELDREEIEAAFLAAERDVRQAARQLEVSPQGLKRRLTQLGLD